MLSNLNKVDADALKDWATYIIVGCGASGSVVAARLSENPQNKILVIELGPNNFGNHFIENPASAPLLWNHPQGPQPSPSHIDFQTNQQLSRKYKYPRGNGFGGSINHHSMIDGRGSPKIYDGIAEIVGDDIWAYKNILPYFKKMESYNEPDADHEFHGSTGWLQIKQGSVIAPLHHDFLIAANQTTGAPIQNDMSGDPQNTDGVGFTDSQITLSGRRSSSFEDLLLPQLTKEKTNVVVIFDTLVTRILITGKSTGLRAIGIDAIHQHHAYTADKSAVGDSNENSSFACQFYASKEVILCGGAINTPQLLLLSGIGAKEHLNEVGIDPLIDLPGVGRHLMDHHEVAVTYEINPLKMVWPSQAATLIDQINKIPQDSIKKKYSLSKLKSHLQKFANKQEQNQGEGGMVLDWYSGLETDIDHDLHIHEGEDFFFDFDFKSTDPLPDGKFRSDYFRSQYDLSHSDFMRVFNLFLIETLKIDAAHGSIRLANDDPRQPPIIDLKLYEDDIASERMARGILLVRKIVKHPLMKQYYKLDENGDPLEIFPGSHIKTIEQLKDYVNRWSAFGHHIGGTAKMGQKTDIYAVVDSRLKVWGVHNLRVIDTSIYPFPYLHGYNTSRGAYLIGEIGADIIKQNK